MREAMGEYRLSEPRFEVDDNWFTIIFDRPDLQKASWEIRMGLKARAGKDLEKDLEKFGEGSEKTVEKTVEKILQLIKKNPKITQEELANKTGLSRRGVEWNIIQLKARGKLKRVGPDKGGYWEIREKGKPG